MEEKERKSVTVNLEGFGVKCEVERLAAKGEVRKSPRKGGRHKYGYESVKGNERYRTRADNVRVVLTHISKSTADGTLLERELTGPLQLKWQHRKSESCSSLVLGGHNDATANLGCIIKTYGYFQLDICSDPWPQGFPGRLAANERMRITVEARADNARSQSQDIDIMWDGQWSDDAGEMQRHLVIERGTRH